MAERVRRWLLAGGYDLVQTTSGGFMVRKEAGMSPSTPWHLFGVLNNGTSLEEILVEVLKLIPEIGDPLADEEPASGSG